jgi:hypothetical protein
MVQMSCLSETALGVISWNIDNFVLIFKPEHVCAHDRSVLMSMTFMLGLSNLLSDSASDRTTSGDRLLMTIPLA